jgi:hypothetical protein
MQQQQQKNDKSVPLPPGNVVYSNDFLHLWSKVVAKEDEDELSIVLLRFLERITRTLTESHDDKVKMMVPQKGIEYYC